jgi:hypothetical protein
MFYFVQIISGFLSLRISFSAKNKIIFAESFLKINKNQIIHFSLKIIFIIKVFGCEIIFKNEKKNHTISSRTSASNRSAL